MDSDPGPEVVPIVWMRSIRYHTYHGAPQPEGAYYVLVEKDADTQALLIDTITNVLKFAVQDTAPRRAVRAPVPEA